MEKKMKLPNAGIIATASGAVMLVIGCVIQYWWFNNQPVLGPAENWGTTISVHYPWYVDLSSGMIIMGWFAVTFGMVYWIGYTRGKESKE